MQIKKQFIRLPQFILLAGILLLAGCASTPGTENSMPWNTPQNWEGSPSLPFMPE